MTYEQKPFVPQSFKQIKKEYMETPFWLGKFLPGSQLTIVEDLPKDKPIRYTMRPSNKGGPAFPVNLIRITDGFVEKDLELSKTNTQLLLVNLPEHITNLKGVVLANDMGRWVFVSQNDGSFNENFPSKSAEIAKSMEPAAQQSIKTINDYAEMLAEAVKMNTSLGMTVTYPVLQKMADKIYPNRALDLIAAAKAKGCIVDQGAEGYRGY